MQTVVIVSGYFNPIHIGHLRLIKAADKLGDKLVVIVNNDHQQKLKKGKIIMKEKERLEIVDAIRYVDEAVLSIDTDPTIVETLKQVAEKYSKDYRVIFGNGGDRKAKSEVPEAVVCDEFGIEMLFDVGGIDKPNSSSNINKLLGLE